MEKFIRSENHLMIYETTEVIDSSEELDKMKNENQVMKNKMEEIVKTTETIMKLYKEKTKEEIELEQLKLY